MANSDAIQASKLDPIEYRKGFKKPKGGKSAFRRASFNKETIPVKVGEAQKVLLSWPDSPSKKNLNLSACAATSG